MIVLKVRSKVRKNNLRHIQKVVAVVNNFGLHDVFKGQLSLCLKLYEVLVKHDCLTKALIGVSFDIEIPFDVVLDQPSMKFIQTLL